MASTRRGAQLRPQVFHGARLAALEGFEDGVVHVLGGHGLDRHAVQVAALLAGGHRIEVAGRGVHAGRARS